MKRTKVERLRAVGGYEGDWGDPSTYAPEGISFMSTGATNSKFHLGTLSPWNTESFCGVGVWGIGQSETLDSLIEKKLCEKCLRILEETTS